MPDIDFENIGTTKEEERVFGEGGDGIDRTGMNLFFLLDASGSMNRDGRIDQLNNAMPIAFDAVAAAAYSKEAEVFIRVIKFNDKVEYIIGSQEEGVSAEDATKAWQNLTASSTTDTAGAIRLCREAMHTKYIGTSNYNPVVILFTDGLSSDPADTVKAIDEIKHALVSKSDPTVDRIWRLAVGVGEANEDELKAFAMNGKKKDEFGNEAEAPMVFTVKNIDDITDVLTNVAVGSIISQLGGGNGGVPGPVVQTTDPIIDI